MNRSKLASNDLAGWRALIDLPQQGHIFMLAAFFLASLLILPYADLQRPAMSYLIVAVLFLYFLSHSISFILRSVLPALFLLLLTGTPLMSVAFIAVLLGGACGAMLLLSCRRVAHVIFWGAAPLVAYGAIWLLKGDPFNALLVLLPLPVALCGFVVIRRCMPRTTAVVALACTLGVTLLAAGTLTLFAMDLLHGNPVEMLGNALRGAMLQEMEKLLALYAETGMTLPIDTDGLGNLVSMIINLLPGIFGVACLLCAYWGHQMDLQFLQGLGMVRRLPMRLQMLNISPVTAILFIIAYPLSAIADSNGTTLTGAVAANFALLLEPGLALFGFLSLSGRGGTRSCLSNLLFFALIAGLFINPAVSVVLAAFCGAVSVILHQFGQHRPSE